MVPGAHERSGWIFAKGGLGSRPIALVDGPIEGWIRVPNEIVLGPGPPHERHGTRRPPQRADRREIEIAALHSRKRLLGRHMRDFTTAVPENAPGGEREPLEGAPAEDTENRASRHDAL